MIPFESRHADYDKNIEKLKAEGFNHFTTETINDIPFHLRMAGATTLLVNDKGDIKSVSMSTGEIRDEDRNPPKPIKCPGLKWKF